MAKKKKAASPEETLRLELAGLIQDIDAEGLRFLINQAHVLLHNLQVDKVNQELRKLDAMDRKVQKASSKQSTTETSATAGAADIEETEGGKHFVLELNTSRKFLTREELRALVTICQAAESADEAGGRLYRWLSKHRADVLTDAKIAGPGDPIFVSVYELIRSRYKTKE